MNGRPVWLASLSLRKKDGTLVGAQDWSPELMVDMQNQINKALHGVGDRSRERAFRMCITLCLHRGLSEAEEAGLPASFHDEAPPVGLAGGPIEILWEKGIQSPESTKPCANPTRIPLPGKHYSPGYYLPEDCGACPSCQARKVVRAAAIRKWHIEHPEAVR